MVLFPRNSYLDIWLLKDDENLTRNMTRCRTLTLDLDVFIIKTHVYFNRIAISEL